MKVSGQYSSWKLVYIRFNFSGSGPFHDEYSPETFMYKFWLHSRTHQIWDVNVCSLQEWKRMHLEPLYATCTWESPGYIPSGTLCCDKIFSWFHEEYCPETFMYKLCLRAPTPRFDSNLIDNYWFQREWSPGTQLVHESLRAISLLKLCVVIK